MAVVRYRVWNMSELEQTTPAEKISPSAENPANTKKPAGGQNHVIHIHHLPFHFHWNFQGFVKGGVKCTLVFSGVIFALYMLGNIPDPGLPDQVIFLLLSLLHYVSLLLCAFSVCALGFSVHRMVEHPRFRNALDMGIYFLIGLLGAVLSMLNSFIIAAAGGNG